MRQRVAEDPTHLDFWWLQTRFSRLETGIPTHKLKPLRMQPMWREVSNQSRWSPPVLAGRSALGGSSPASGGEAIWAGGGRKDEASSGRNGGNATPTRSPRHSVITSSLSGSKSAAVVPRGNSRDAAVRVPQDMPDLPRALSLPRASFSRPRVRTPRTHQSYMLSCRFMCHCTRSRSRPCLCGFLVCILCLSLCCFWPRLNVCECVRLCLCP
jgi:hypothetical protein